MARRIASVVVALPWRTWPIAHPSIPTRRVHHQTPGSNISLGLMLVRQRSAQVSNSERHADRLARRTRDQHCLLTSPRQSPLLETSFQDSITTDSKNWEALDVKSAQFPFC